MNTLTTCTLCFKTSLPWKYHNYYIFVPWSGHGLTNFFLSLDQNNIKETVTFIFSKS